MADEMTMEPTTDQETAQHEAKMREQQRHQKLVAGIVSKISKAEEKNREHVQQYQEIHRLYMGLPNKKDVRGGRTEPGRTKANVANLELHRCVESVTSAEDSVLWGDNPNWEAYDPELDDQFTGVLYHVRSLIEKGHEKMGCRNILKNAMRSKNKYGRVLVEVLWKRCWRWKRVREIEMTVGESVLDATTGEMLPGEQIEREVEVYKEVLDVNQPEVVVHDPWNVYMDGRSVKTSSWVAIRRTLSDEELDDWIRNAKDLGMTTRSYSEAPSTDAKVGPGDVADTVEREILKDEGIRDDLAEGHRCIDFWGRNPTAKDPSDTEGKTPDRRMYRMLLVDGKTLCIEGVNPYDHGRFPFLDSREIPLEGSAEGLGTGQLLRLSQIIVNSTESLLQEMLNFGAYGVWRRTGGGARMPRAIRIFPGRVLDDLVDGPLERMPMDMAPFKIGQSMMAIRVEGMRAASGATSNAQAMPSGANFAVEVRTIAAESARRLAGMAQTFADDIYRPLLEMEMELYEQFMEDDEEVVTPVPYEGRTYNLRIKKQELALTRKRAQLKLATDLDFRKNMSRNINQAANQNTQLIAALRELAPEVAAEAVKGLMPGVLALQRKQLSINGVTPDLIPKDLAAQIVARIEQAQAEAEMAKKLEMAMAMSGVQPEGGKNVPVAA